MKSETYYKNKLKDVEQEIEFAYDDVRQKQYKRSHSKLYNNKSFIKKVFVSLMIISILITTAMLLLINHSIDYFNAVDITLILLISSCLEVILFFSLMTYTLYMFYIPNKIIIHHIFDRSDIYTIGSYCIKERSTFSLTVYECFNVLPLTNEEEKDYFDKFDLLYMNENEIKKIISLENKARAILSNIALIKQANREFNDENKNDYNYGHIGFVKGDNDDD